MIEDSAAMREVLRRCELPEVYFKRRGLNPSRRETGWKRGGIRPLH